MPGILEYGKDTVEIEQQAKAAGDAAEALIARASTRLSIDDAESAAVYAQLAQVRATLALGLELRVARRQALAIVAAGKGVE